MKHAYASFNKAVAASWGTIAPGVEVVYEHPTPPATMPTNCLRIYWLEPGGPTRQPNWLEALIQLDVFVSGNARATALQRCSELDEALGFYGHGGYGRIGRFDFNESPALFLSEMKVVPYDSGWIQVSDKQLGVIHYSRRVLLQWEMPTGPAPTQNLLVLGDDAGGLIV